MKRVKGISAAGWFYQQSFHNETYFDNKCDLCKTRPRAENSIYCPSCRDAKTDLENNVYTK